MKKSRVLGAVLAATLFATASFGLAACSKDAGADEDGSSNYTVTFNANTGAFEGGAVTKTVKTDASGKIAVESIPTATKEGNKFAGWYNSVTSGSAITVATYTFDSDMTLYAHWTEESTGGSSSGGDTSTGSGGSTDSEGGSGSGGSSTGDESGSGSGGSSTGDEGGSGSQAETKVDGVYIGGTLRMALTLNSRFEDPDNSNRKEYWLGGSSITLSVGDVVTIYMNNELMELYVEESSSGINKPDASAQVTSVTVKVAGPFEIYLHKNDSDWSCQYSGPAEVSTGSEIPQGCAPVTITFGNSQTITFYLVTASGSPVGESQLSGYVLYTYSDELFGNWATSATNGKLKTNMSVSSSTIPAGWIFRWGSGFGTQTSDIKGAFEFGGTYVVKLPSTNKGDATITKISV